MQTVLHANSFTYRTFTCKQAKMSNSVQRCFKNGVWNFIKTTNLKPYKVDGAPISPILVIIEVSDLKTILRPSWRQVT